MGDRANVFMKSDDSSDNGVYLYTHWSGSELPVILQDAMKRKQRWDDTQYLCRIIFCEMVRGHEKGEAGFGISGFVGDGDDRILTVNTDAQTITSSVSGKTWTFEEYINLNNPDW